MGSVIHRWNQRRWGSRAGINDITGRRDVEIPLEWNATVFQAEVQAVFPYAMILIKENATVRQIRICSDSKTTLTAI